MFLSSVLQKILRSDTYYGFPLVVDTINVNKFDNVEVISDGNARRKRRDKRSSASDGIQRNGTHHRVVSSHAPIRPAAALARPCAYFPFPSGFAYEPW